MTPLFQRPAPGLDPELEALRADVRAFLAKEMPSRSAHSRALSWTGSDAGFSARMAARGWVGMTFPKAYGGHGLTPRHRYVVLEEMLAAGAPVGAHWIADRQSGPTILRFGTEEQRRDILPRIAAGQCFFCIGMSEPGAGSDLASARTRAVAEGDSYRINGTKVWTTGAHICHYMILFCRTDASGEARHDGFSQFLVPLETPGITINPIIDAAGEHHFNEVVFQDVILPAGAMIGRPGDGWKQVMSELAYERSGPERFLSSFTLYAELVRLSGPQPSERAAIAIGRVAAHVMALRRLSRTVAGMLAEGEDASVEATIVKDLGATLEQEIPEIVRALVEDEPRPEGPGDFAATLARTILHVPAFSIRGGTREILRGIIARSLGLR